MPASQPPQDRTLRPGTPGTITARDAWPAEDETAEAARRREAVYAQARRAAADLEAVLEQVPAAVYLGDATGIRTCNALGLRLYGVTSLPELHQRFGARADTLPARDAHTGAALSAREWPFVRALAGETSTREVLVLVEGHELVLHCAGRPVIEGGEVVGAVAIHTDLTPQRRAEEALRTADKAEAVGRLAGGIAHEFNNILMGILGYVHLVLDATEPDDPHRNDVLAIAELSQRAVALTAQMLAFAQRQVLRPQVLDVHSAIGDVEPMVRSSLGTDIELRLLKAAQLLPVEIDRGQMQQVLITLLLNARDAMPAGGVLVLQTGEQVVTEPLAAEDGRKLAPGRYVRVAVTDTGPPLEQGDREGLFAAFPVRRPGRRGQASGLGTVRAIARQCGGDVLLDAAAPGATTFALWLPAHHDQAHAAAAPLGTGSAGTETILVAEDDDAVREVVVRSLRRRGYTVLEARHGAEALEQLQQHKAAVALVISDLIMPVMGGRELYTALHRLDPTLPVLLMSGYADDSDLRKELSAGRAAFLQKPFRPDALARLVRELLDKRARAHPHAG